MIISRLVMISLTLAVPPQKAFASSTISSKTCEAALSKSGERPTIVWDMGLEHRRRFNWTPYVGQEVILDYAMITPDIHVVMAEEAGMLVRGKIPMKVMKSDNVGLGPDIQAKIHELYAVAQADNDNEVEHAFFAMRANADQPWQISRIMSGGGLTFDASAIDAAAELFLLKLELVGPSFSRSTVETLMVHTHPSGWPLSLPDQNETKLLREKWGFGRASCIAVDTRAFQFEDSISFILTAQPDN